MRGGSLVYTVEDVMERTGLSKNKTYSALSKGEIPGLLRCGKRVLVSRAIFDAWVSGQPEQKVTTEA